MQTFRKRRAGLSATAGLSCFYYLRRRLASGEGIVSLGVRLSRCVCVRRISLGGEGNALYSCCLHGLSFIFRESDILFVFRRFVCPFIRVCSHAPVPNYNEISLC